ncbi:MAG: acyl-CoA dehydrogenase family protein [Curvibacter lanceolatus]|jgi:acyl-CoA dehydrogenase|uniref:acyl-CoA dehydrogenase family protein n=1 Tax=Curvibacter lanceolatus TaxID=86182 RepID=UPI002353069D|nr:acyl-CoA dehydrogenase family protein [Curvibacter lanceolatus]MBV5293122.1 acyl-CoA dehydrogenase family protein [Curvibacter lanceolatus]
MSERPDDTLQADRAALSDTVARFARSEIAPHVGDWDAAGEFPRSLYRRAGDLGLLGLGYPEAYGGTPAPYALRLSLWQALCRHGGSGGVLASLLSHNIGLPPILHHGSEALREQVIPPVLRGEQIAALAITEPGGGSDVAALRTTARREGDHYVIDGEKTFITSGLRADWITLAVRTGEPGSKGAGGLSVIVVPGASAGLTRQPLQKMGWLCSDTAQLHFDGVRVPASHLLGEEGAGFRIIMGNFNAERFGMSAAALGFSQACYDEALAWARQRKTFGAALVERQVIRHKLVDMQMRIHSTAAWLEQVAARADAGDTGPDWVAQVCLLKNHSTQTMQFCADQAVQILGGMGFMRGTVSERLYREVKVMMIGGGAEEIMKDLAARQWGL